MNAIVYYVDFHWDNYQGGSGKSFEMRAVIDLPDAMPVSGLYDFIHKTVNERVKAARPFPSNDGYSVQRIEII